ncbi:MAG TPA: hypothetical protein VFG79_22000, partial [Solirubrobacter sp.]|nr:hypothetical protein [Solirubrobacter sp.]
VTVDPRPQIPVTPYWLSVVPCTPDPQWTVPGGGRGEHFNSRTFTMPKAGRIVAVGGHLHGGATRLVLSQPACGGRTLVTSRPSYAPADDGLYAVRPLLHEPDPKSISWWQSPTGWAIGAGEKLTVTAAYDATRPHMRVMGIDHLYLAPPAPGATPCAPPPPDAQILGPEFTGARAAPPRVRLTLARIGSDGRARASTRAPGPTKRTTNVRIAGFAFRPPNLIVKRGAVVRWRFRDHGIRHDVTVASGPVGFGSPWHSSGRFRHRFTQPGRYLLQCSLHPAYMSQVVRVRR